MMALRLLLRTHDFLFYANSPASAALFAAACRKAGGQGIRSFRMKNGAPCVDPGTLNRRECQVIFELLRAGVPVTPGTFRRSMSAKHPPQLYVRNRPR